MTLAIGVIAVQALVLALTAGRAQAAFDPATLPPNTKSVMVGEVPFVYSEQGQGDPFVIFTPYPFGTGLWADFAKRMSASAHVFVVEPAGLRDPGAMKNDFSAIHLLELYRDFFKAVGIREAHVMGVGESGAIAAAFGHHWPHLTKSVVTMNGLESANWSDAVQTMLNAFKMAGTGGHAMVVSAGSNRLRDKMPSDDEMALMFVPLPGEEQQRAFQQRLKAFQDDIQTSTIMMMMPNVNKPVLVLRSKDDQLVTQDYMDRTRKLMKNASLKFETIEGAGHFAFIDQPEKVTELVRGFIAAHPIKPQ
jgi:pimeloyl-ACP methyl ester carboxylesterase